MTDIYKELIPELQRIVKNFLVFQPLSKAQINHVSMMEELRNVIIYLSIVFYDDRQVHNGISKNILRIIKRTSSNTLEEKRYLKQFSAVYNLFFCMEPIEKFIQTNEKKYPKEFFYLNGIFNNLPESSHFRTWIGYDNDFYWL